MDFVCRLVLKQGHNRLFRNLICCRPQVKTVARKLNEERPTTLAMYKGADKCLARPGSKQANVSVRMA